MRGRQKRNLYVILSHLPWWLNAMMSIGVYLLLSNPPFLADGQEPAFLFEFISSVAFIPAFVFALMAVVSAFKFWRMGRLFRSQSSIETIRKLSWRQFEYLVAEAYRQKGYTVEVNTRAGSDGGIDVIAKKKGETTIVQCKHWSNTPVGVSVVREVFGVAQSLGVEKAAIVCSHRFTKNAREFALKNQVQLIDGAALVSLINSVKTKVRKSISHSAQLSSLNPKCPLCGGDVRKRTAKRGKNVGRVFLGCVNYPDCNGLINIS